jgi:hypothetical protein
MADINITQDANLTSNTAPALADRLMLIRNSDSVITDITPDQLLKVINLLTADTAPAIADLVATYDASASGAKKVTLENIFKIINGLTSDTAPDPAADYVVTYDASASAPKKVLLSAFGGGSNSIVDGRLTLATGVPVTTTDQTAKTTVYYTPYLGNRIALYDGSATWNVRTTAEISVAVPATTVTPFDVFCYDNAGVATLEATNWTNDTTRATALTYQDGVLVKTGATTRRYLGTGRTTGSSGQIESSTSKRFLWNYYNRVVRHLSCVDTTDTWDYTTATWRAVNTNTTAGQGRVEVMIGVAEDALKAAHQAACFNANSPIVAVGIALDATNTNHAQVYGGYANANGVNISAFFEGIPTAGYHFIQRTEISTASGTTTWKGDAAGTIMQTGMIVDLLG